MCSWLACTVHYLFRIFSFAVNYCMSVCSGLPYDVTNEEALKHEEVQKLMEESIQQLRLWSDKFLSLILSSLDQIPYGMRCIAKVMFDSLTQKFPDSGEKDILKVIATQRLLFFLLDSDDDRKKV